MPRRNRRQWRMDPREVQALQELRRSNAATPVPSGKEYKRKKRTAKQESEE